MCIRDRDTNPTEFSPIPGNARESYRLGLQALNDNNPEEARQQLERAWANRDQLDGMTRQSIQDQLTRLTMSKPAQTAVTENLTDNVVDGALVTAIDPADPSAQQRADFRKLQSEVFRERARTEAPLRTSPREALEKMTSIRSRVTQSDLCLLYTSPIPRDATLSRMPSSA